MFLQLCKEFEVKMVFSKFFLCFGIGDFIFFSIFINNYMFVFMFDFKCWMWDWWLVFDFLVMFFVVNIGQFCGISFEFCFNVYV